MSPAEHIALAHLHAVATASYRAGCRGPECLTDGRGLAFLTSLGISAQFLYDCVDDLARYGEPDEETFHQLTAVRCEYFRQILGGTPATRRIEASELPPKPADFEGVPWLPRIIGKAKCFLEGTLCTEIMYGCSGDRRFLAPFHVTLPEFLEIVRDTGGDASAILLALRNRGR